MLIFWSAVLLLAGCSSLRRGWLACAGGWLDAATGSRRADISMCPGRATPLASHEPVKTVPGTMGEIYREPQPRAPQEGDTQ